MNINTAQTLLTSTNMTADYRELEMLYKPITAGVRTSNDLLEIYLDQSLVASYTRASSLVNATSASVYFGGNSSAGTGQVNWSRIEFVEGATLGFAAELPPPAPEPSSLALLGLGAAGMFRRRNRSSN